MKSNFLLPLLVLTFVLTGCSNHEHTFSDSWSFNEAVHYHEATCEHTNLVKDMTPHTFVEGVCSTCGYIDPNYVPEPKPYVDIYYLPSHSEETYFDDLYSETTYEYDNDLHGYKEVLDLYEDDPTNYTRRTKEYRYNEDYTELKLTDKEEHMIDGSATSFSIDYFEYKFLNNNSYIFSKYIFNKDTEQFDFDYEIGRFYNSKNQKVFEYTKLMDVEFDSFYYSTMNLFYYNEEGYRTKSVYFDGRYHGDQITYISAMDIYEYNEDFSSGIKNEYYNSENGYIRDGYVIITSENINGIRYDTEVNYSEDDVPGNTNIFGYDKNLEKVYSNYGGMHTEEEIKKNDTNKIVEYSYKDTFSTSLLNVEYASNGKDIVSSYEIIDDNDTKINREAHYCYNDAHQMSSVSLVVEGLGDYQIETNISYSTLQNDKLLEKMDIYKNLIHQYSHEVLVEGLI